MVAHLWIQIVQHGVQPLTIAGVFAARVSIMSFLDFCYIYIAMNK